MEDKTSRTKTPSKNPPEFCPKCAFLNEKDSFFCRNCGQILAPPPPTTKSKIFNIAKNTVPIASLVVFLGFFMKVFFLVFLAASVSTIGLVVYWFTRKAAEHPPEELAKAKKDSLRAMDEKIAARLREIAQKEEDIQKALDEVRLLDDDEALALATSTASKANAALKRQAMLYSAKEVEIRAIRLMNLVVKFTRLNTKAAEEAGSQRLSQDDLQQFITDINGFLQKAEEEQSAEHVYYNLRRHKETFEKALEMLRAAEKQRAMSKLARSVQDVSAIDTLSPDNTLITMQYSFDTLVGELSTDLSAIEREYDRLSGEEEADAIRRSL